LEEWITKRGIAKVSDVGGIKILDFCLSYSTTLDDYKLFG